MSVNRKEEGGGIGLPGKAALAGQDLREKGGEPRLLQNAENGVIPVGVHKAGTPGVPEGA